jgi:ABC-type glycerol-3-phosphate transport system permease component
MSSPRRTASAIAAIVASSAPSVIMAGTLIGTLPVVAVFVLLGRQIVGGIIAGAVKG